MAAEELRDARGLAERSEALFALVRQEQRDSEAAVEVRQRDQHEAAARPDVQRVLLDGMEPPAPAADATPCSRA